MKRGILILGLGLIAAVAAFALTNQRCGCCDSSSEFVRDGATRLPELAWLQRQLHLTSDQVSRVRELHLVHQPVCRQLCERIETCRRRVADLVIQGNTDSPALATALAELAAVETDCRQALYRHVHRTAAVLSPEQARTYYRLVLAEPSGESPTASHPAAHHP